jgi:hypothetical protein
MYKLFAVIEAYYPKFCEGYTETKLHTTVDAWYDILNDLPYNLVTMALKKHVLDSVIGKWQPSVTELRHNALKLCDTENESTGADAWGEVIKAIGCHGHYNSEEALNSMSETTRQVVKQFGFKNICFAENMDVVRGQFLKMYELTKKRQTDIKMLPKSFIDGMMLIQEKYNKKLLKGGA